MESSRDDHEGDRSVPHEKEEWDPWSDDIWSDDHQEDDSDSYFGTNESDKDSTEQSQDYTPAEPVDLIFLFRGGHSFMSDPYFDSPMDGELLVGVDSENMEFYLYGGLKILQTNKSKHEVYHSIGEYPFMLTIGGELRYYPMAQWRFFSPYVMGRVGGMVMFWSYRNELDGGDRTITTDSLGGVCGDLGLGVDIVKLDNLRLGAQIMPQLYLFGLETSEGFTNDYFTDGYTTIRWSAEAGFTY